jgi:hypothetical protein
LIALICRLGGFLGQDVSDLSRKRITARTAIFTMFDYSGQSAHALKRVQRTGIAVQQSSAAVQPRPLGMG